MNPPTHRTCTACGYAFKAGDDPNSCPDCASREALMEQELHCQSCGYNLYGIENHERCPECGHKITAARSTMLVHANREWLETVRSGIGFLLISAFSGVAIGITAACFQFLSLNNSIGALLMFAQAGFALYAVFLITAQDPRQSYTEGAYSWRNIIRVAAIGGFVATVLQTSSDFTQAWPYLGVVAGIISFLSQPVQTFGQYTYLERFARRMPDDSLARSTVVVKWGSTISLGVGIAAGIVIAATVAAAPNLLAGGNFTANTAGGNITATITTPPKQPIRQSTKPAAPNDARDTTANPTNATKQSPGTTVHIGPGPATTAAGPGNKTGTNTATGFVIVGGLAAGCAGLIAICFGLWGLFLVYQYYKRFGWIIQQQGYDSAVGP